MIFYGKKHDRCELSFFLFKRHFFYLGINLEALKPDVLSDTSKDCDIELAGNRGNNNTKFDG